MTRSTHTENTSVGLIQLATKTCDHCGNVAPDDHLGWITVTRDIAVLGEWTELDFCKIECLGRYFA